MYTLDTDAEVKVKELILYVAEHLKDQRGYGATLLNKALFFIDNFSYYENEKPVTNLQYIKQDHGPTPKPSQFLAIKDSMISSGEMIEIKSDFFGLVQKKCIPKRAANIEVFEKEEIVLIDKILAVLSNYNATDISNLTHRFLSWQLAENRDNIPLFTCVLSSKPPTDLDIIWANTKMASFLN